ncbi:MAG: hypothetical protein H0T52_13430 [Lautropia sp.]|nr:hypothetical protein [Lautropia sp.]
MAAVLGTTPLPPAFGFAFALSPAFTFNFWDTFGIAFEATLAAPREAVSPRRATDVLLAAVPEPSPALLPALLPALVPALLAALVPALDPDLGAGFAAGFLPSATAAFPAVDLPAGLFGTAAPAGRPDLLEDFLDDVAGFIGLGTLMR